MIHRRVATGTDRWEKGTVLYLVVSCSHIPMCTRAHIHRQFGPQLVHVVCHTAPCMHTWTCSISCLWQVWEGWSTEDNSWEPEANITEDLVRDYENRMAQDELDEAAEAAEVEEEIEEIAVEVNVEMVDEAMNVEVDDEMCAAEEEIVDAADAGEEMQVDAVVGHNVYSGARAGSMKDVYVKVRYTDGSVSGFVEGMFLEGSAALRQYVSSGAGRKIARHAT